MVKRVVRGISLFPDDLEIIREMQDHGFNLSSFVREKLHERYLQFREIEGRKNVA